MDCIVMMSVVRLGLPQGGFAGAMLLGFWGLAALAIGEDRSASEQIFREQVASILETRCVTCHNDLEKKGGLSLSSGEGLLAGGDEGEAITPGDPAESRLVNAVRVLEGEAEMPKDSEPLSEAEFRSIEEWVRLGGAWPKERRLDPPKDEQQVWWSLRPMAHSTLPEPGEFIRGWARNSVDYYIGAKLAELNLRPSDESDRRTLIRRVYFDLVGLPPSPEDIERFTEDEDPLAFERMVDRLLASPRYGERWARHWLDVVRFAESDGFEKNLVRPNAWPYRDYVIGALNSDHSYADFVREQLAGDRLGADAATGFLVGGAWDEVKSPDPVLTAQQRADELHDMVSTTSSAFLGLTVGCARCHSHKFDPIPQSDYYAMKACLEGVRFGERELRPPDYLDRLAAAEVQREELRSIERALWDFEPHSYPALVVLVDDAIGDSGAGVSSAELVSPTGIESHSPGTKLGEANWAGGVTSLPNLGGSFRWWKDVDERDVFAWMPKAAGEFRIWLSWGCGRSSHAKDARYVLDMDGDLSTESDQVEVARVDQRMSAVADVDLERDRPLWSGFHLAGAFEMTSESKLVLRGVSDGSVVTADVVAFEEVVGDVEAAPGPHLRSRVTRGANVDRFAAREARFVRMTVTATTDIEPCIDEFEIFTAEPEPRNVALAAAGTTVRASGSFTGSPKHRLEHIHDGQYGNSQSWISDEVGRGWAEFAFPEVERIDRVVWSRDREDPPQFEDRTATQYLIETSLDGMHWEVAASSSDRLPRGYPARAADPRTNWHLSESEAARYESLIAKQESIHAAIAELMRVPMVYAGRFEDPAKTYRFHRGDPMQPREEVAPGGLSAVGVEYVSSEGASESDRRVALADWIASEDNPLTARVAVNRLWHYHFGRGIVSTPSDFGANGGTPTHPELLDFLAQELIDSGWSLKSIHRLIVTSATYRQASRLDARCRAIDAESRYLWRYPPRFLEAEPLRDAILATSGVLDLSVGGPGFDLFEPNTNYVKVYNTKKSYGTETFRRMVYQQKPRMQLDEVFGVFDCPDAGQVAPSRSRSVTPLQSLSLLNSSFLMQQSELFADRVRREAGSDVQEQVKRAFWLAFGRPAREDEIASGRTLVQQHGLVMLCRALFNANEFMRVY